MIPKTDLDLGIQALLVLPERNVLDRSLPKAEATLPLHQKQHQLEGGLCANY